MIDVTPSDRHSAARVLALIVGANGSVKACELQTLESLKAFERLDVSRRQFLRLSKESLDDMGQWLSERGHLQPVDVLCFNELLDQVRDRQERLLVCRLAAAVVTADGHVCPAERSAYEHMLARWRVTASQVSQAILDDTAHR